MAEFVMKDLVEKSDLSSQIYVESAATSIEELGNDIHPGTKSKLREVGIPFSKRAARQITLRDYVHFDYIIVMDSHNLSNLRRIIWNDPEHKVYRLLDFTDRKVKDIADPWYTGDFDTTYKDVLEGCKGLLKKLI